MENNNENINADETSSSLNNNIETNGIFAKPIEEVGYAKPVVSENASNQVWSGLPEESRVEQPVQPQVVYEPQVEPAPVPDPVPVQIEEQPVVYPQPEQVQEQVPPQEIPAEVPVQEEPKKGGGKAVFIIIPIILALFGGGIAFFALTSSSGETKVMKDAPVDGSSCFEEHCNVYIGMELYEIEKKDNRLLGVEATTYKEKLKFDLYLSAEYKVSDYKVFVKATNEDVTNISDENELRKKIGLFPFGTNEEELTYTYEGYDGVSIENNIKSTFKSYVFTDKDKNIHVFYYFFKGKNKLDSKIKIGKKYKLTFEVVEDDMGDGYKNLIKSVK